MAEWETAVPADKVKAMPQWKEAVPGDIPAYDPSKSMPLGDIPQGMTSGDVKELGKGVVEGAVGLPLNVVASLFRFGKQTPQQYDTSMTGLLGKPKDEGATQIRQLGELGGSLVSPLPLGGVAKGAKKAVEIGERIAPGAVKRAQSLVERIAQSSNPNVIGNAIRDKVMARFKPMFEARQKEFAKWLEQHDPKNQIFRTAEDQAAAEAAFDREFAEKYKELSKDLNEFGDTLGKHATQSVKYAQGTFKFDPLKLPADAFKSKASVESLKRLTQDDKFVGEIARDWTATELRRVTEPAAREGDAKAAAKAAREWFEKAKQDWLQYIPDAAKDAEDFVSRFEKIAATRKHAKWVAGTGALAGAAEMGFHPLNWARHQLGL